MKKIIYLFAAITIAFTACTPLEDIYDELDAQGEAPIVGDVIYTLTEEDYTKELDKGGYLGFSFPNFNSEDQAKEMLPFFLENTYPVFGEGSSAIITYKLYNKKNDEKSLETYTVTNDDYDAGGHSYGNFSRSSHITDFLDTKYPNPANRLLVSLTYKYYSGSVATLNNGFLYLDGAWEMITGFTDDEYEAMGEGYSNFSSEDEAFEKVPVFLKDKFKFEGKVAGDIEGIMYKLYVDGTTKSFVAYFIFDGENWSKYNNTIDKTLQLGFENGAWAPDNTIKYTLTAADYDLVGNGRYGNFDVRAGKDEETVEARLAKINTILLNNNPTAQEGQKYVVSYAIYNGSNAVWTMKVIKEGDAYILNE